MKLKYLALIFATMILNTSCTGLIIEDYSSNNDDWDKIIKVRPTAPKNFIYKYGKKYYLVSSVRTYNYYKDRLTLYRYIDNYGDTYESDYDLGYTIYRNGRKMHLELFKDEYSGKFYYITNAKKITIPKIKYKYGMRYRLVETETTYNYYRDRHTLYRYIDNYDDTYESDYDLGFSIYRNGRRMFLELFKDTKTGKFYVIDK